jgi:hypothetical protein
VSESIGSGLARTRLPVQRNARGGEARGSAPGVQNAEESDGGPEMFGIGGDFQQGIRAGLEQQTVDLLFVLQGERGQFMRQSKHDVEVAHREHFRLSFGDPAIAGKWSRT